jgi:hypothetical protein
LEGSGSSGCACVYVCDYVYWVRIVHACTSVFMQVNVCMWEWALCVQMCMHMWHMVLAVSTSVHVCACVQMCPCMHAFVCAHAYVSLSVWVCNGYVSVHVYEDVPACICMCAHMCEFAWVTVHMYVYVCACVDMHVHVYVGVCAQWKPSPFLPLLISYDSPFPSKWINFIKPEEG